VGTHRCSKNEGALVLLCACTAVCMYCCVHVLLCACTAVCLYCCVHVLLCACTAVCMYCCVHVLLCACSAAAASVFCDEVEAGKGSTCMSTRKCGVTLGVHHSVRQGVLVLLCACTAAAASVSCSEAEAGKGPASVRMHVQFWLC